MTDDPQPTRASINDVVTTSSMVSKGFLLTGVPTLGYFSVESLEIVEKLIA